MFLFSPVTYNLENLRIGKSDSPGQKTLYVSIETLFNRRTLNNT